MSHIHNYEELLAFFRPEFEEWRKLGASDKVLARLSLDHSLDKLGVKVEEGREV